MYIYIYIHTYVHTNIYIYIYIYVYVHTHTLVYTYTHHTITYMSMSTCHNNQTSTLVTWIVHLLSYLTQVTAVLSDNSVNCSFVFTKSSASLSSSACFLLRYPSSLAEPCVEDTPRRSAQKQLIVYTRVYIHTYIYIYI